MDKQMLTDLMSSLPAWPPDSVEISEDRATGYGKPQYLAGQEASSIGPCLPGWWETCLFYFFFSHWDKIYGT